MNNYQRAKINYYNDRHSPALLIVLIVCFPIAIFYIILSSSIPGKAKAIVSLVLLAVLVFIPIFLLETIRTGNEYNAQQKAKIGLINTTSSLVPVKIQRSVKPQFFCLIDFFVFKVDQPECKPGFELNKTKNEKDIK
jgi:hypothetical protein